MSALWWSVGCLIVVGAILLREVCRLHARLRDFEAQSVASRADVVRICEGARIDSIRLSEVERQSSANEAALELQDVSIDNHERALRAQENLSILHAEVVTRLEGRIAKLERNPFHSPVRRDN